MKNLIIAVMAVLVLTACEDKGFEPAATLPTGVAPSVDPMTVKITGQSPLLIRETEKGVYDLSVSVATADRLGVIRPGAGLMVGEAGTLGVRFGMGEGMVARGNDSRFGFATSLNGQPLSTKEPLLGQVMMWNGLSWAPDSIKIPAPPTVDESRLLPDPNPLVTGHYLRLANDGFAEYRSPTQMISDLGLGHLATMSLPVCAYGESLGASNGALVCVKAPEIPSPTLIPACAAGQMVVADGTELSCANVPVAMVVAVKSIAFGNGLLGGTVTSTGTISVNAGTGPNQIVQLDSTGKLPPIDGSALTGLSVSTIAGLGPFATITEIPACAVNQRLSSNGTSLTCEALPAPVDPVTSLGYTPLNKAGDTMLGDLSMGTKRITNLGMPTAILDAVPKSYADSKIGGLTSTIGSTPTSGDVLTWGGVGLGWIAMPPAAGPGFPDIGLPGTYTKVTIDTKGRVVSGSWIGVSDIPSLDASKITSGTLSASQIPNLDASKITSGTLPSSQISNLDASKITSGILAVARIPALSASQITSGVFDVARIPDLDAAKVTTGVFSVSRIPGLSASQITAGTFDTARIPALDASKITSGVFATARIPALDAAQIVSGVFNEAQIPLIEASKLNSPNCTTSQVLTKRTTGLSCVTLPTGEPIGTASGDLGGSYPAPTVVKIQGRTVSTATPADGNVLSWSGPNSRWQPTDFSGLYSKATTCPTTMHLISDAAVSNMTVNGYSNFCIDKTVRASASYGVATITCAEAGSRLCIPTELTTASKATSLYGSNFAGGFTSQTIPDWKDPEILCKNSGPTGSFYTQSYSSTSTYYCCR